MKKILICALVMIAICGCGCTRNNGNIGDWFGIWKLNEITESTVEADGSGTVIATESFTTITWSFQNKVVLMKKALPDYQQSGRVGTWEEKDGKLYLDYTHSEDGVDPGKGLYKILEDMHLPAGQVVALDVKKLNRRNLVLTYTDEATSHIYTYYFTKW